MSVQFSLIIMDLQFVFHSSYVSCLPVFLNSIFLVLMPKTDHPHLLIDRLIANKTSVCIGQPDRLTYRFPCFTMCWISSAFLLYLDCINNQSWVNMEKFTHHNFCFNKVKYFNICIIDCSPDLFYTSCRCRRYWITL